MRTLTAGWLKCEAAVFGVVAAMLFCGLRGTHGAGAKAPAAPDWTIVHGEGETTAVMLNVEALAADLRRISSGKVALVAERDLGETLRRDTSLILVGEHSKNGLARKLLEARGRSAPFAADAEFVKQQGYVVDLVPDGVERGRKAIVAAGWAPQGAMNAVSHMRTRMLSRDGSLYLDAEGSPESRHPLQFTQRPSLEERGVYYYLAAEYDYPPLTPASWDEKAWEHWVDKAVCAQFTHIHFCLWGGTMYYFPGSPACHIERNRLYHERVRHMIGYAHTRGLKVTCLLSPTFIPTDIVDANSTSVPGLRAGGFYGEHLKTVCQAEPGTIRMGDRSWNGAAALIRDVMSTELDWFKDADSFQVWFFDPGGCYCGPERQNCKGLQDQRLMEQVTTMTELVWERNPRADIEVHLWPMWLLQTGEYIGWEFRDAFLERLKGHFSAMGKMDRITVCDVLDWPGDRPTSGPTANGLGLARDMGFRTNGFIYTTGAETGYCFVNPGFNLLAWETAMAKQYRVRAAYMYRYEEGSKHPQTYLFSRCLWNLNEPPMNALRQYVNWIANTSPDAADKLFDAFVLIDSFTCEGTEGQDHEAKGARIRRLVDSALAELPRWRQEELEWLLTTARSLEILGRAVEHRDDPAQMDRLARSLVAVTGASPSFRAFSKRVLDDRGKPGTRFAEYVGWLAKGWYQGVF